MLPSVFTRRQIANPAGWRAAIVMLSAFHLAALGLLIATEHDLVAGAAFLFAWVLVNSVWFVLLRRPIAASLMSLLMFVVLILLSRFKQEVLVMTANFIDVLIIDPDTISFLLTAYPSLRLWTFIGFAVGVPLAALMWWFDPFRVRFHHAFAGAVVSLGALTLLSFSVPMQRDRAFIPVDFISQFARSGVLVMTKLATHGLLEADGQAAGGLPVAEPAACPAQKKLPHIVLVLDESSFDMSMVRSVKLPEGYRNHFKSFDGENRLLLVEGAGGPTWYTEYNVLSGLSARSFGHFAEFVTRIAAGRVSRSLPNALHHCGYRTYSLYPWLGAFLGARHFQKTLGIEHFFDAKDMKSIDFETDDFYYDHTAELIARERQSGPVFVLSYLMANHFPWSRRWRPDLAPDWVDPGNGEVDGQRIDEYLRRQEMSARAYRAFTERLKRDFPGEPFLIVRFGDHQPMFAKKLIEPGLDPISIGRLVDAADPRYFTTYYAIDALNFAPADLSSAIGGLDAAYLPLVVLEAAGVPLDATFQEQKRILNRCKGRFYLCANGAEASRFNRLLIDAGLIKRL